MTGKQEWLLDIIWMDKTETTRFSISTVIKKNKTLFDEQIVHNNFDLKLLMFQV
jgi:hypothetical protein